MLLFYGMNKKSFTIVEIMVVMAVIGIIMTLSIVGIQAAQKQQRVTTITNDMNQFKLALASYYSDYRQYPACADEIVFDTANNQICIYQPNLGIDHTVTKCESSQGKVATVKLSQPGVFVTQGDFGKIYTACADTLEEQPAVGGIPIYGDQALVIPSAEQWVLDYRALGMDNAGCNTRSQSYKIRYCDESGRTEFLSQ